MPSENLIISEIINRSSDNVRVVPPQNTGHDILRKHSLELRCAGFNDDGVCRHWKSDGSSPQVFQLEG